MNSYGHTFNYLRTRKGISLSTAAADVVSNSFLSRFEHGHSNISFHKLIALLANINVSVEEFIYLDNRHHGHLPKFHYEETKDYLNQVERSQTSANLAAALHQYKSTSDPHDYLDYLKIKARFADSSQSLTAKQRQFVYDYLFTIESWTHYELRLFMATLSSFSNDQIFILTNQMVKNGSETVDVNWNHQADFLYIILRAALLMALAGEEPRLSQLIALAYKSIHNQQYLYEKSELHFLKGLQTYLQGNHQQGQQLVAETLRVFKTLAAPDLLALYQRYWHLFLKRNSKTAN
ncbi:transcriptional regulator [Lentilactobacillus fungorum]|uniref:Transcriptional regulator n=1 Tax=Lentilactobacillus fungorum TaxID=2201250 RepID=A0ABQ3VXS7_9LACO|nr:Rgg/GadR/MutR family transcriptional regulator [Lentilactobacillus fungorum]GHP13193.1 transcriptional regulator [Lentilactobacillus fungorum]